VLTPAEWRVVEALRHGHSAAEIARHQGVSNDAIKYHVGNVLLKLGLSRRAEVRRWAGVRRDSNLFRKEREVSDELRLGPLCQIARTVQDIDAARSWYQDVLGLTHLYSFPNLAFFDCGGVRLFLSQGESRDSESVIYFRVDDVRVAHEALCARGVQFSAAPHMIYQHPDGTEEWLAAFNDNEGRPLAIMAQVKAQG
jgi:DNA-binding CsgD family transcriptional regulator/catechol 2,3-dioxygenase-like lactoylglutathione lyase family enzyme